MERVMGIPSTQSSTSTSSVSDFAPAFALRASAGKQDKLLIPLPPHLKSASQAQGLSVAFGWSSLLHVITTRMALYKASSYEKPIQYLSFLARYCR